MKHLPPSNLEMQVLSVLWEHGPLTARTVLERMPDAKPRAYTTILSVLQVMEKKGLVNHETEGNRHVYSPRVKPRAIVGPLLDGLVKTIFGGRPSRIMQHLLEASEVTDQELTEMQSLLAKHQQKPRGSRKN